MRGQDKLHEQRAFDHWAEESGWRTFTEGTLTRLAGAFLADARTAGRVLDLACGTGEYTEHLARAYAGALYAVDLSLGSVRACKRRVATAGAIAADAERLPFPDGAFGAVFLGNVLHHFPDPARLLGECSRVLQPGGRLFAVDPNPGNPIVFVYRVVLGARTMKTENEVLHRAAALSLALSSAGFERVVVGAALPLYFVREYYARNLGALLSAAVWPMNVLERLLFASRRLGRKTGSFLVSRAVKPRA